MTRKKPKLLLISSLAVLGTAFALILAMPDPQHSQQQANLAAKPVLTVTATRARIEMLPVRISAHGNIVAWQEASIGAEADGLRLTEVRANVGDSVEKGQLLASFASATVQAELDLSRAERSEAEALYAEAKADLKRTTELQNSGALSSQQIQRYITAAQSALARLEAAKARETTQELRLAQTKVLAPDHGIISARTATVGAVLPAGQELFRLIRGGRLEWRAEVSSEDLAKLQPGQTAHLTLADGSRIEGMLRMLSPLVDTQSRNALVYVDLAANAANSSARSGMFARGQFELAATEVITLPQSAVQLRDGFSYVLRIGEDSKVIQTKVKTGRRNADRIEIAQGLELSDQVVATGSAFLGDGDLIKVVDPQPSFAHSLTGDAGGEPGPMM